MAEFREKSNLHKQALDSMMSSYLLIVFRTKYHKAAFFSFFGVQVTARFDLVTV